MGSSVSLAQTYLLLPSFQTAFFLLLRIQRSVGRDSLSISNHNHERNQSTLVFQLILHRNL